MRMKYEKQRCLCDRNNTEQHNFDWDFKHATILITIWDQKKSMMVNLRNRILTMEQLGLNTPQPTTFPWNCSNYAFIKTCNDSFSCIRVTLVVGCLDTATYVVVVLFAASIATTMTFSSKYRPKWYRISPSYHIHDNIISYKTTHSSLIPF
jgi:hypothetical protein